MLLPLFCVVCGLYVFRRELADWAYHLFLDL